MAQWDEVDGMVPGLREALRSLMLGAGADSVGSASAGEGGTTAGDVAGARALYNRSLPLLTFQAVFRMDMTKEVLRRRGVLESTHVRVGAVPDSTRVCRAWMYSATGGA